MADAYRTLTSPRTKVGTKPIRWLPPFTQTIRFRLSLTIAVAVFAVGSTLIGGMYAWQVHQFDRPTPALEVKGAFLSPYPGGSKIFVDSEQFSEVANQLIINRVQLRAIEELRKASLVGLGVLVVVAFCAGYVLSGLALRPIDRMTTVARDISGTNLARRINLTGPNDELKRLGDTFDAMLDRLQAAFEDQRRFIQDTSHELRNPLASARTNLEFALSDPEASADELRSAAEIARRSTERMSVLVDNLLSQARTGVPEVVATKVSLADVATEAAADHQVRAVERNLDLVVEVASDDHDELMVSGDRDALVRAASNLISNSVRLAPAGSTITVATSYEDGAAVLSVSDEGPGLTEAEQANVFKRFWRGSNAGAGTGLGLSIVKQISERHGGRVTVRSEPGTGSVFSISIPTCASGRSINGGC